MFVLKIEIENIFRSSFFLKWPTFLFCFNIKWEFKQKFSALLLVIIVFSSRYAVPFFAVKQLLYHSIVCWYDRKKTTNNNRKKQNSESRIENRGHKHFITLNPFIVKSRNNAKGIFFALQGLMQVGGKSTWILN